MVSTVKGTTTLFLAWVLLLSTKHLLTLLTTEAINHLWKITWATGTWMADFLTIVNATVQYLATLFTTGVFATSNYLTRHILRLFFTITSNWNTDVAWWTSTGMAQNLTIGMFAVFVLFLVAVLTTRVWKYHWVVLGLFKPSTVAQILGKFAFRVWCITVGTGPVVHIKFLTLFTAFFFFRFFAQMVLYNASLLLFLFILTNVLF